MKTHDENAEIIEKALKSAYRKQHDYTVKPDWQKRVMSTVLYLDTAPSQNNIWDTPDIWRVAAAVSMSALIMLACSFTANIGPEYEAAKMFLDDPMGIIFTQPLFP